MVFVLLAVAWITIGVVTGVVEARHGHWSKSWVLGVLLGPLAIPLAVAAHGREREARPRTVVEGDEHGGDVDVLVGVDGSAASLAAATTAVRWFGTRLRRITIATVLDFDTAAPHADSVLNAEPWDEELYAEAMLQSATETVSEQLGFGPSSVVLAGRPAAALESYAIEHGFDLVVIGRRGRGLSKALLGSCASRLASRTHLPVLLVPDAAAGPTVRTAEAGAGERL